VWVVRSAIVELDTETLAQGLCAIGGEVVEDIGHIGHIYMPDAGSGIYSAEFTLRE